MSAVSGEWEGQRGILEGGVFIRSGGGQAETCAMSSLSSLPIAVESRWLAVTLEPRLHHSA